MPPELGRREMLTREATDVEMNGEDPCAAQVKRAKTIMSLEICVLKALNEVFDEPPETPTNLAGTPGENETDEDVVSPEVTEELNRLKKLGRPYTAAASDVLCSARRPTNGGRGPSQGCS